MWYKLNQRKCFKEEELINCFSKIRESTGNFFESSFLETNWERSHIEVTCGMAMQWGNGDSKNNSVCKWRKGEKK